MTLPEFVKVRGIMCRVTASGRTGVVTVATPVGVAKAQVRGWYDSVREGHVPLTDQMWTDALEWAVKQAREMVKEGMK